VITEGYLARHYQGRRGGRDFALLDVAQDYALKFIADKGLFDLGLTFKGGTALRKYRMGGEGRFSTDLDFAPKEPGMGELVFEELDGASLFGFQFRVEPVTTGRRAILRVETPLGNPQVDARIELSAHSPWLNPEVRQPLPLFVHEAYEFTPPAVPVLALEETIAEKLAAFRRRSLLRDLYDLAWISRIPFNEAVVRKLTYLKVYVDVVEDTLGTPPFHPAADIIGRELSEFPPEDIGLLSGQLNMGAMQSTGLLQCQ